MPASRAYYNDIEPFAAAWLRTLIARDLIAPGEVDERSIEAVAPGDLAGFTQCHFFAGVGVWSYALRSAGWSDDTPVWTGSCPCQPFSQSGKGGGFDDKRHLWPAWHRLIRECRPDLVFGEQVASAPGLAWFDVVSADLESAGYAVGAADICAAGVGAPHIRQRLYFVADAAGGQLPESERRPHQRIGIGSDGEAGELADAADAFGRAGERGAEEGIGPDRQRRGRSSSGGAAGELGDTGRAGLSNGESENVSGARRRNEGRAVAESGETSGELGDASGRGFGMRGGASGEPGRPAFASPLNGFWSAADWLWCRDEKYRPVEPGTFPLASGATARVGRLRGYGNALNAETAKAFIEAWMSL